MIEQDRRSLAPIDQAHREAMLEDLVMRMQRLHRRRRARKTASAAGCLLLLTMTLALSAVTGRRPLPRRPIVAEADTPAVDVRIVRTDPAVLDRYVAEPGSRAIIIDDEALLNELALIGQPAGLIRMGNRIWLTADVVGGEDEDGEPPKPPPTL
jgi:hypothetical protein